MKQTGIAKKSKSSNADQKTWILRLYIAGKTPRSVAALRNLQVICDTHLAGKYKVEVVDLAKTPRMAAGDQIIAIPTLVRKLPAPLKRVIGDLADVERVLIGLDLC